MSKTLVEMSTELVTAQCSSSSMNSDELVESLRTVFKELSSLQQQEAAGGTAQDAAKGDIDPKRSISKYKIVCLECGEEFKTLSYKHLASHGLSGRDYRKKWGIPLGQPLCARELTERRSKDAKLRGVPKGLSDYQQRRAAAKGKAAAGAGEAENGSAKPGKAGRKKTTTTRRTRATAGKPGPKPAAGRKPRAKAGAASSKANESN